MYSPRRLANTFTGERFDSLFRSPSSPKPDLSKSLRQVETRSEEFSKSLKQKISETSIRSPMLPDTKKDLTHNEILRRGEEYAKHVLTSKLSEDVALEIQKNKRNVEFALKRLEEIKDEEHRSLAKKISDLNTEFTRRVTIFERGVIKQIENMKNELMFDIRREENECENRIKHKAENLIEESAPVTKKKLLEKVLKPSAYNSKTIFTDKDIEKKLQSSLAFQKLEESREKFNRIFTKSQVVSEISASEKFYQDKTKQSRPSSVNLSSHRLSSSLSDLKRSILSLDLSGKDMLRIPIQSVESTKHLSYYR